MKKLKLCICSILTCLKIKISQQLLEDQWLQIFLIRITELCFWITLILSKILKIKKHLLHPCGAIFLKKIITMKILLFMTTILLSGSKCKDMIDLKNWNQITPPKKVVGNLKEKLFMSMKKIIMLPKIHTKTLDVATFKKLVRKCWWIIIQVQEAALFNPTSKKILTSIICLQEPRSLELSRSPEVQWW